MNLNPRRAAVIGHPVSHSKSPAIHNYWIKKYGLDVKCGAEYGALDVSPENLEREIARLKRENYAGFNVTVPHKEKIMAFAEPDSLARAIGAVNTVINENGVLKGTNTDAFGFIENIAAARPGFDFAAGPAVVLGAGGAARAVVYALLKEGAPEVRLANRTRARARDLAEAGLAGDSKKLRVHDWDERSKILAGANLLVNATSMGMKGQPALEMDLSALPETAPVNDIVYAPLLTDLLRAAGDRGNPVITGIGMLLHQAQPAFKAWFGVMPEVDEDLQNLVLA